MKTVQASKIDCGVCTARNDIGFLRRNCYSKLLGAGIPALDMLEKVQLRPTLGLVLAVDSKRGETTNEGIS